MMAFLQRLQKHLGTYGGWTTFDNMDMWIQKGGSQSNDVLRRCSVAKDYCWRWRSGMATSRRLQDTQAMLKAANHWCQ